MLADIELQFVPGEQDPIRHLRAIVSRGHISGMMVYPDYFLALGGRNWIGIRTEWNKCTEMCEYVFSTRFTMFRTTFRVREKQEAVTYRDGE